MPKEWIFCQKTIFWDNYKNLMFKRHIVATCGRSASAVADALGTRSRGRIHPSALQAGCAVMQPVTPAAAPTSHSPSPLSNILQCGRFMHQAATTSPPPFSRVPQNRSIAALLPRGRQQVLGLRHQATAPSNGGGGDGEDMAGLLSCPYTFLLLPSFSLPSLSSACVIPDFNAILKMNSRNYAAVSAHCWVSD